jgi:hypothetical protein
VEVADRIHALLFLLDVRALVAEFAFPDYFKQVLAVALRADGYVGIFEERLVVAEEAIVNYRLVAGASAVDADFLSEDVHYGRFSAMPANLPGYVVHPAILVETKHF